MIRSSGGIEPAGGVAAVQCLRCAEVTEGSLTVGVHVTLTFCL